MWIELKIVISYPKTLKMSTSIDGEFLARATIALFAPRPMLDHQQGTTSPIFGPAPYRAVRRSMRCRTAP